MDMYAPPDLVKLRTVRNDRYGPARDAVQIRNYIMSALSKTSSTRANKAVMVMLHLSMAALMTAFPLAKLLLNFQTERRRKSLVS